MLRSCHLYAGRRSSNNQVNLELHPGSHPQLPVSTTSMGLSTFSDDGLLPFISLTLTWDSLCHPFSLTLTTCSNLPSQLKVVWPRSWKPSRGTFPHLSYSILSSLRLQGSCHKGWKPLKPLFCRSLCYPERSATPTAIILLKIKHNITLLIMPKALYKQDLHTFW